ncbi:Hypothetical protein CINCED_3A012718 [Cinara cedri]|uniref:Carbohydrate kinase PfkB domain-containing protein n=1 Tax=Cinara cedri TaxID=506608 RepID=A0A5E4MBH6_9HEMI|nr:Hypothetical protein CINCED_3A012718 [Cinara cedri]
MLAGRMKQVNGGVARNLADALGRLGHNVRFMSVVGGDSAGQSILESLRHIGTDYVTVFKDIPTSWCVVLQNPQGDCVACIGDMACHRQISVDMSPLVVVDGNVPADVIDFVVRFCNEENIPVYFETTDIAVAARTFQTDTWKGLSFISPNLNELGRISEVLKNEEARVNYAIKVSVKGDDDDDIMNSSKDVVRKLISHIPVVMLASRQPDDTVSMVHYPAYAVDTPVVSVSGAGDW